MGDVVAEGDVVLLEALIERMGGFLVLRENCLELGESGDLVGMIIKFAVKACNTEEIKAVEHGMGIGFLLEGEGALEGFFQLAFSDCKRTFGKGGVLREMLLYSVEDGFGVFFCLVALAIDDESIGDEGAEFGFKFGMLAKRCFNFVK